MMQEYQIRHLRIFSHFDRIDRYSEGCTDPITIEIHPTDMCNLSCSFCAYNNNNCDYLDNAEFEKIVNHIINSQTKAVIFSGGGEPTMHELLPSLIKLLHDHDKEVGLITNGTQLDIAKNQEFLLCKWIRISLNAINPTMYYETCGQDLFDQTIRNIEKLQEQYRGKLGLSFVKSKYFNTIEHYKKAIEISSNLNTKIVTIHRDIDDNLFDDNIDIIMELMYYAKKMKIDLNYKLSNDYEPHIDECNVAKYNLFNLIGANGKVYPCIPLYRLDKVKYAYNIDKLYNSQSFCFNYNICNGLRCRYKKVSENIDSYRNSHIHNDPQRDQEHINFI